MRRVRYFTLILAVHCTIMCVLVELKIEKLLIYIDGVLIKHNHTAIIPHVYVVMTSPQCTSNVV